MNVVLPLVELAQGNLALGSRRCIGGLRGDLVIELLEPSWMGFVHLLQGVLNGAVVVLGLIPIAGHHGKVERWREDGVVRE